MGTWEKCPDCNRTFLSLDVKDPMDVVVHIELREAPHPKFTDLLNMGGGNGFGSGNAFGKLTNKQREHFLTHLLRYAKMLLQEAETRYDYDVDYGIGIDTGRMQI